MKTDYELLIDLLEKAEIMRDHQNAHQKELERNGWAAEPPDDVIRAQKEFDQLCFSIKLLK